MYNRHYLLHEPGTFLVHLHIVDETLAFLGFNIEGLHCNAGFKSNSTSTANGFRIFGRFVTDVLQ